MKTDTLQRINTVQDLVTHKQDVHDLCQQLGFHVNAIRGSYGMDDYIEPVCLYVTPSTNSPEPNITQLESVLENQFGCDFSLVKKHCNRRYVPLQDLTEENVRRHLGLGLECEFTHRCLNNKKRHCPYSDTNTSAAKQTTPHTTVTTSEDTSASEKTNVAKHLGRDMYCHSTNQKTDYPDKTNDRPNRNNEDKRPPSISVI